MGGAVRADKARAVDGKAHRQLLDGDVVHHLVIGALEECRVDRRERLVAFGGQPTGKGHAVLLGDADIEGAIGEFLAEQVEPGPDGIAAVIATILSSRRASSIRLCANTLV